MTKTPLVSCLCVTRNKINFLQRAIECFRNQTYPNKELIIVYESDDSTTKALLEEIEQKDIKIFEVSAEPKLTLGALRNYSIEVSAGEYFCQWDDDDWYHDTRIEKQMDAMKLNHKQGSILIFWLMYDAVNHDAYLSSPRAWEGSILCHRSVYPTTRYSDLKIGEDVAFVRDLIAKNILHPIVDASLYIYSYHGNNTWGEAHFQGLFAGGLKLSKVVAGMIKQIADSEIPHDVASSYLTGQDLMRELNYLQHINNAVEMLNALIAAETAKGNVN